MICFSSRAGAEPQHRTKRACLRQPSLQRGQSNQIKPAQVGLGIVEKTGEKHKSDDDSGNPVISTLIFGKNDFRA